MFSHILLVFSSFYDIGPTMSFLEIKIKFDLRFEYKDTSRTVYLVNIRFDFIKCNDKSYKVSILSMLSSLMPSTVSLGTL